MKNVLVILIATIMVSANLVAQEVSFEEAKPYLAEFERFIEIPNEYSFHSVKKVQIDVFLPICSDTRKTRIKV